MYYLHVKGNAEEEDLPDIKDQYPQWNQLPNYVYHHERGKSVVSAMWCIFFMIKLQQRMMSNLPPDVFLHVAVVGWNVRRNKVVQKTFHKFTNLKTKGEHFCLKC